MSNIAAPGGQEVEAPQKRSSRDLCSGLEAMRARIRNLHHQYGESLAHAEENLGRLVGDHRHTDMNLESSKKLRGTAAVGASDASPSITSSMEYADQSSSEYDVRRGDAVVGFETRSGTPKTCSGMKSRSSPTTRSVQHHLDGASADQKLLPTSKMRRENGNSAAKGMDSVLAGSGGGTCAAAEEAARVSKEPQDAGGTSSSKRFSTSGAGPPPRGKHSGEAGSATSATAGAGEKSEQLASLLSYLDAVDEENQQDLAAIDRRSEIRHSSAAVVVGDKLGLLEMELQDKRAIVQSLREALQRQRREAEQAQADMRKDHELKLAAQKREGEEQAERQLALCDRLLKEKTEMTKRISGLAEELKAAERKFSKKIEEMAEDHTKDVARQKQNWATGERLRREGWEKDKTREIKEVTIKGLEPEIERILSAHRTEKKRMEDRFEVEKQELQTDLEQRHERRLAEVREAGRREQDRVTEKERERLREESEKLQARQARTLEDAREGTAAEIRKAQDVCDRRVLEMQHQFDAQLREAREKLRAELEQKEAELKQAKEELFEKNEKDAQALRERTRAEIGDIERRIAADAAEKATVLEEKLRADMQQKRDWELEQLTTRLGKEQFELEKQFASKLEAEKKLLWERVSEDTAKLSTQLADALAAKAECESRLCAAETSRVEALGSKDLVAGELFEVKNRMVDMVKKQEVLADELEDERRGKAGLENAYARQENILTDQVAKLRRETAEAQAEIRRMEEEAVKREGERAGLLEERVRATLAKKDAAIEDLKKRLASKENQVKECEFMLAKQRDELLAGI
mmetsp:Transcript_3089/g.7160  ORF Transcript_3089/g.7160 Transcript_3089/m.7160 type:complete len:810 (-) Transcript_3089:295-2724(-)